MLTIDELNSDVLFHFFSTLYADKIEEYNLVILQDRQSVARPLTGNGELKTYLFYHAMSPKAVEWQKTAIKGAEGAEVERTIGQKDLRVVVNFLGQNAASAAAYFDHAINSNLAYSALRPIVGDRVYEFQYNNHTEAIDLSELELKKWVSRWQMEIVLGFVDSADFAIDVFSKIEVEQKIETGGVPAKPIIVKTNS